MMIFEWVDLNETVDLYSTALSYDVIHNGPCSDFQFSDVEVLIIGQTSIVVVNGKHLPFAQIVKRKKQQHDSVSMTLQDRQNQ